MSREPKIGLLLGLAFIILFGIILSEKGADNDRIRQIESPSYQPVVELVPSAGPDDLELVKHQKKTPVTSTSSVKHGSKSSKPAQNTGTSEKPEKSPRMKELLSEKQKPEIAQIPASSPTVSKTADTKETENTETKNSSTTNQQTVRTVLVKHEVKPGQTLVEICRKYYPGKAYNMLKKVMKTNDISDPKKLLAGQNLKIPVKKKNSSRLAKSNRQSSYQLLRNNPMLIETGHNPVGRPKTRPWKPSQNKAEKPKVVPKNQNIEWYVVKSKDTLSKIARKFYGRERAWHKLYKHNSDIIDDPDMLKKGQKIRIPQTMNGLASNR